MKYLRKPQQKYGSKPGISDINKRANINESQLLRMLRIEHIAWRKGIYRGLIIALRRWARPQYVAAFLCLFVIAVSVAVSVKMSNESRYKLSLTASDLVGTSNAKIADNISYNEKNNSYVFNKAGLKAAPITSQDPANPAAMLKQLRAQVGGPSANIKTKSLYSAEIPVDASKGISYTDNNLDLSFSLVPMFSQHNGRYINKHLIYPTTNNVVAVYTAKNNGIKEDLIFLKPERKEVAFKYKLKLPDGLQARLLDDGGLGVYSADPSLYGTISYGTPGDQAVVMKSRRLSPKNNLVFALPAPVIVQQNKAMVGHAKATFSLDHDELTVNVTDLNSIPLKNYPVSLDPSVIVTSTSDFLLGEDEDKSTDYITANQIGRSKLNGGSVGTWSTTLPFSGIRFGHSTAVYNGYMYIIGGVEANVNKNDVQYALLNPATGAVGAWATASTVFTNARHYHSAVAYNGFLYILGGFTTVDNNDVQYASLNPNDGSVGAWSTTTPFAGIRDSATSVAYKGYIYEIGGTGASTFNDVQYAPFNANGTVGTWTTSGNPFSVARSGHTSVVYNNFLYVLGGTTGASNRNDVQYAPIKPDGSIGAWTTSNAFASARYGHTTVAYNGIIYVMGGFTTVDKNDVQYAMINANGSVGIWRTTTAFGTIRDSHTSIAANGYIYIAGGASAPDLADIQFTKVDPAGATSTYNGASTPPTVARTYGAGVAYNGFIYILGGCTVIATDTCTTASTAVSFASIAADGTLGSYADTANALPAAVGMGTAVAYEGRLYYIAGRPTSTTVTATIYLTTISSTTGNTTAVWTTVAAPTGLTARYGHASVLYNGKLYVIGGCTTASGACAAFQNDVEEALLNTAGGFAVNPNCANTFCPLSTFATPRWGHAAVIVGNFLYISGGTHAASDTLCNASASTDCSDVQVVSIAGTGVLGSWAVTTSMTAVKYGHAFYTVNGYLYESSGKNTAGTFLSATNYAKLTTSGTISADSGCGSAWCSTVAAVLAKSGTAYAAYNGVLIIQAGQSATATVTNGVNSAAVTNGGTGITGIWATTANVFATIRANHTSVVRGGYIYVIGGKTTGNVAQTSVQVASMNADGTVGTWTAATPLPVTRWGHSSVVYNGYLYVLGGLDPSAVDNLVTYAKFGVAGALAADSGCGSSWCATTVMLAGRLDAHAIAYNGFMYLFGGSDTAAVLNADVSYAPINASGTLGIWHYTHNSIDDSTTFVSGFNSPRSNHSVVQNNGYVYVIGGSTGANVSDVQYAKLNADGTIGTTQSSRWSAARA